MSGKQLSKLSMGYMNLTSAPNTFKGLMNEVLRPYPVKFIVVYLEDIFVYSKALRELNHHKQLYKVLTIV